MWEPNLRKKSPSKPPYESPYKSPTSKSKSKSLAKAPTVTPTPPPPLEEPPAAAPAEAHPPATPPAPPQLLATFFDTYDVIVVGAGLIGSAAARHVLKMEPHLRVCLVGPAEGGPGYAQSCHADEGRITRRTDPDEIWATLASRSLDR